MNIRERLKYYFRYARNKKRKTFAKPPAIIESVVSEEEMQNYLRPTQEKAELFERINETHQKE